MPDESFPSFFQPLQWEGPLGWLVLLFSVTCTGCLLVGRVRDWRRVRPERVVRDFALLISAPVATVLYALAKAIGAAQSMERGGIDADFGLIYGMSGPKVMLVMSLVCFAVGVVAVSLPRKVVGGER